MRPMWVKDGPVRINFSHFCPDDKHLLHYCIICRGLNTVLSWCIVANSLSFYRWHADIVSYTKLILWLTSCMVITSSYCLSQNAKWNYVEATKVVWGNENDPLIAVLSAECLMFQTSYTITESLDLKLIIIKSSSWPCNFARETPTADVILHNYCVWQYWFKFQF